MKIVRARRAARRRRVGPPRRARPGARAASARRPGAASSTERDIYPAYVDRVLSFVDVSAIAPLRIVVDAANGMAGAMLPPVLERLPIETVALLLRARRELPEPRAEPAAAGEPRVHRREDARGGRRLRRRVRRRRRPLLLRRRHGRVRPRRLRDRAPRRGRPRAGAGREDHLRRPRELGRPGDDRGRRRRAARQPRRPRVHQAPHARGGRGVRRRGLRPLLLPRLLPGRLGRRAVPAHARARLEEGQEAVGDPAAVPRALLHHRRAEHARRRTSRSSCSELEERFGPEGTVSHLDGVSVDADDWHFNVRPSNTEPLLRLNLEARSQELMERKRDEVLAAHPRLSRTASATRSTERAVIGCGKHDRVGEPEPLVLAERRGDLLDRTRSMRRRPPRPAASGSTTTMPTVRSRSAGSRPAAASAASIPSTRSRKRSSGRPYQAVFQESAHFAVSPCMRGLCDATRTRDPPLRARHEHAVRRPSGSGPRTSPARRGRAARRSRPTPRSG